MGLLRLILAISIVSAHAGPIFGFSLITAENAVETFYIFSGFYMSLILNEKYVDRNGSYKLFVTNRFLRIYPAYWFVLILTIIICLISFMNGNGALRLQVFLDSFSKMNIFSFIFLCLTNILIFGQDLVMFLGINLTNGSLFFTENFTTTSPQLNSFLLVPQAWVVGLEMMFYIIAPFLLRKRVVLVTTMIVISLIIRLFLYGKGLTFDPWTYRFFPTELIFFLIGNVSYKIYKRVEKNSFPKFIIFFITIAVMLIIIFYNYIPFFEQTKKMAYYILITLSIPFVFVLTKNDRFDRTLGELSYPVFISHMLILYIILSYFHFPPESLTLIVSLISIFFSIILLKIIISPIDRIRQSRIKT